MKEKNEELKEWINVTDAFTEDQKNYNNKYLEINEVYDNQIEVSLFSSEDESNYEIYFGWGKFYGIVYVNKQEAFAVREEMKTELQSAYMRATSPTGDFINYFAKKYSVQLPFDLFFNFDVNHF